MISFLFSLFLILEPLSVILDLKSDAYIKKKKKSDAYNFFLLILYFFLFLLFR